MTVPREARDRMTDIEVRFATVADQAALCDMIDALDRYYQDPPRSRAETEAAVADWLNGGAADPSFALAFVADEPVGLASVGLLYPGNNLARLLFLKDLFVVAEQRSNGVGAEIMRFLARYCRDQGIGRIEWVVETERAQRFYANLGAVEKPKKTFMRLDGAALAALAEE